MSAQPHVDATKSTLTSNIYPSASRHSLADDREFLNAISDPEALDILWHYNGTQGSKLNSAQRRLHGATVRHIEAPDGGHNARSPESFTIVRATESTS